MQTRYIMTVTCIMLRSKSRKHVLFFLQIFSVSRKVSTFQLLWQSSFRQ